MEFANLLMVFVRTVEHGSFSATARSMNMSPSAVSKRISGLENRLGVRLLNRSTRRITLTNEGRMFHERAKRIAADIVETEEMVVSMGSRVRGTLRVTANVALAKAHLLPLFPEFLKRYPGLHLVLELTDRPVDLAEEGIDVAIRFTEQIVDTSVVARKLLTNRRVICASRAYLDVHGIPATPEDLLEHNCLRLWTVTSWNEWEFEGPEGTRTLRVDGNFEANSADAVYHAALTGLGVARLSTYLVGNDLKSGRLVQLLPDYVHQKADILAVYPDRRNLAPKARVFIDFLSDRLGALTE